MCAEHVVNGLYNKMSQHQAANAIIRVAMCYFMRQHFYTPSAQPSCSRAGVWCRAERVERECERPEALAAAAGGGVQQKQNLARLDAVTH